MYWMWFVGALVISLPLQTQKTFSTPLYSLIGFNIKLVLTKIFLLLNLVNAFLVFSAYFELSVLFDFAQLPCITMI